MELVTNVFKLQGILERERGRFSKVEIMTRQGARKVQGGCGWEGTRRAWPGRYKEGVAGKVQGGGGWEGEGTERT